MKKIWIIILIVILINIVVFLTNVLISAVVNKGEQSMIWSFGDIERSTSNIRKEEKINIENIEDLEFIFKSSDINVTITDDEELKVIQYSNKELKDEQLFKVDKTSSKIEVEESKQTKWWISNLFIFRFNFQMAYDIYIPEKYTNNLKISSASGDIYIGEEMNLKNVNIFLSSGDIKIEKTLKANELNIRNVSGDIKLENIEANKIEIESTSGDIEFNHNTSNLKADEVRLKTISGDIELGDIESNKLETESTSGDIELNKIISDATIKSISGNIEVEDLDGKINAKTTSGDISLNKFRITGDSEAKSTSGNIKIYIDRNSNCVISTKSTSGDIKLPDDKNVIGTEEYNKLNLETTSGNIKVENI